MWEWTKLTRTHLGQRVLSGSIHMLLQCIRREGRRCCCCAKIQIRTGCVQIKIRCLRTASTGARCNSSSNPNANADSDTNAMMRLGIAPCPSLNLTLNMKAIAHDQQLGAQALEALLKMHCLI